MDNSLVACFLTHGVLYELVYYKVSI